MNKDHILTLKRNYEFNGISLAKVFQIACDDAYTIRATSSLSPIAQCKCRANDLAFPLTASWVDLNELLDRIN